MRRQALRRAHLIVPAKTSGAVGSELDIVGRIGIDEISRLDREIIEIATGKDPVFQDLLEPGKVSKVSNRLVLAKGHVEFTALVEATESVETSAVEIIEKLRGFSALRLAILDQSIEANTLPVETLLFVSHLDGYHEPALQMAIKVYEVGIDVVQTGALWVQTQRGGESAAEGLNVAPG